MLGTLGTDGSSGSQLNTVFKMKLPNLCQNLEMCSSLEKKF